MVNNWQYSIPTFLFVLVLWKVLSYKPTVRDTTCDPNRVGGSKKKKLSGEEYIGGMFVFLKGRQKRFKFPF